MFLSRLNHSHYSSKITHLITILLQLLATRTFLWFADPLKFIAALEALNFCDYSLCIKAGVHFTLCGGTIAKLGTQKHHDAYIARMDTLDLPGCFGMTEVGHGSNVMGIETQVRCSSGR